MPADAYAGQVGSSTTPGNQDNKAPADRGDYDPTAYANQPGAAARAAGYPRSDGTPSR